MIINRVAEEKHAPSWIFEKESNESNVSKYALSKNEVDRIIVEDITDDKIVSEREQIEKCASNGSAYHYNSSWNKNTISQLKEYAILCGLGGDKFIAVDPSNLQNIKDINRESQNHLSQMRKSYDQHKGQIELDPFKLDEKGDMEHLEQDNWEDIKRQADMNDKPSFMNNSVKPLRGGEDYNKNPFSHTPRGQNSITDPDAIENFSRSEDTGERLRKENEEKSKERQSNHKEWEKEKLDEVFGNDIIAKGKVFPTEVMNAQPGLDTSASKVANFKAEDLPDKTHGEQISENNDKRRESIQRETTNKDDWQKLSTSSKREISGDFVEALQQKMM